MRYNITAPILGFDDQPITHTKRTTNPDGSVIATEVPALLRDAIITALNTPEPRYHEAPVSEIYRRGFLATQAHTHDELELDAEDVALIKRLVKFPFPPVVVYRVHQALEAAKA